MQLLKLTTYIAFIALIFQLISGFIIVTKADGMDCLMMEVSIYGARQAWKTHDMPRYYEAKKLIKVHEYHCFNS